MEIQARLLSQQDEAYRDFHCKLIPTVPKERVIGVRTPLLRTMAKELKGTKEAEAFLRALPHAYYDENNLHALLIGGIKDFSQACQAVDAFLPHIDNWATCDMLIPKAFRACPPELMDHIVGWIASPETYTVRFGLGTLMRFYLDEQYQPHVLELAASVRSEEYYINMMVAWFFATALSKQYDDALPYIKRRELAPWTHNKAIQKAMESFRVTADHKQILKALKV